MTDGGSPKQVLFSGSDVHVILLRHACKGQIRTPRQTWHTPEELYSEACLLGAKPWEVDKEFGLFTEGFAKAYKAYREVRAFTTALATFATAPYFS